MPRLYQQRGRYYDLYTRQHALESNLFLAPGEGDTIGDADREQAPEDGFRMADVAGVKPL